MDAGGIIRPSAREQGFGDMTESLYNVRVIIYVIYSIIEVKQVDHVPLPSRGSYFQTPSDLVNYTNEIANLENT